MAEFTKQPVEDFTIAIDFAGDLDVGETLASKVVTATELPPGSGDKTATIVVSSAIDEALVTVRVHGGEANHDYKITVKVTTSTTHVYEHDVTMNVREL
jgi:hypothetical protein